MTCVGDRNVLSSSASAPARDAETSVSTAYTELRWYIATGPSAPAPRPAMPAAMRWTRW